MDSAIPATPAVESAPSLPTPLAMVRAAQAAIAAALNHLLSSEAWARETLMPHAGKIARFGLDPFAIDFVVLDDGRLGSTPATATDPPIEAPAPDVTLSLPWQALPTLLASAAFGSETERESAALRQLRISGDADLAQAVGQLARHLRWDVEEDLSRAVGDIVAHRVVGGARRARAGLHQAGERFGSSVAEFLTEEQPTLVARWRQRELAAELRTLRDDLDRLEQRVARLQKR